MYVYIYVYIGHGYSPRCVVNNIQHPPLAHVRRLQQALLIIELLVFIAE
jgi:hypothetical protein